MFMSVGESVANKLKCFWSTGHHHQQPKSNRKKCVFGCDVQRARMAACMEKLPNNGKMFGNIWRYKRKIKNTCRPVGGHVCFFNTENTHTHTYEPNDYIDPISLHLNVNSRHQWSDPFHRWPFLCIRYCCRCEFFTMWNVELDSIDIRKCWNVEQWIERKKCVGQFNNVKPFTRCADTKSKVCVSPWSASLVFSMRFGFWFCRLKIMLITIIYGLLCWNMRFMQHFNSSTTHDSKLSTLSKRSSSKSQSHFSLADSLVINCILLSKMYSNVLFSFIGFEISKSLNEATFQK